MGDSQSAGARLNTGDRIGPYIILDTLGTGGMGEVHRAHEADPIPQLDAKADGNTLTLCVSRRWLDARPLVRADLEGEPDDIAGLGIILKLEAV